MINSVFSGFCGIHNREMWWIDLNGRVYGPYETEAAADTALEKLA